MTKSLKQVIEALIAQGLNKIQVVEILTTEYWFDQSVERFLATV
jgi:hypothetical protein